MLVKIKDNGQINVANFYVVPNSNKLFQSFDLIKPNNGTKTGQELFLISPSKVNTFRKLNCFGMNKKYDGAKLEFTIT